MLHDIKNTIKQSAIYGLSRISTKLVAFILLPLLTLNFTVAEYGIYVLTESLWQILWAVFLFGFESGIVRWYLELQDELKRKRFLFSVSVFLFVFNLILILIIYGFSPQFSLLIYGNISYARLVVYSSLIAAVEAFSFIIFLLLRIEEKAKTYSIFAILITLISLLLQVYFLQYTNIKLEGVFISKIIAPLLIILTLFPYFLKHIRFGFEKKLLKDLLKYSFPIMAASLVIALLNQIDRYILGYFTNLTDVGIFGLANNIAGLISFLIISPFSLAFTVLSWKKLNDENAKRFFTKTTTYLFLAVIFISAAISLFTPHLIKVFTLKTDYWIASQYVPLVILAMPFYGIHFIGVFSFYVTKKTKYVLYSYLAALLIKILLNLVFIPSFSVYGAAIVNILSFFLLSWLIYIFSKKNYFFAYEWLKILEMIFAYALIVFPFFYFNFEDRLIEIILKVIALAVFPFLLYILKFYEPIEIKSMKGFINKHLFKIKV
ncbi:MAG: oligosaccharide flippase family protein [Chlorobi bacterium]|nr:oligosaccharide flippase family protein [Chlorobiota bacterium]MCI0714810.1 oligosaccharide flippase family protein [Chlorobiota bacterium]